MTTTLPSPKIVIADAPEVTQFDCEFIYNYFEKDERENDSGLISKEFATKRPSEGFDATFIESKEFNRFTSRYVKFNWKPVIETKNIIQKGVNITIKDNLQKIHYEQDFLAENYTSIVFQDSGVDEKLNFFVKRLIRRQTNIDSTTIQQSPTDLAKNTQVNTSEEIESSFICESMSDLSNEGYTFLDNNKQKIRNNSLLDEMKDVKTFAHFNSKFVWDIMKTGLESNLNVFEDEIINEKNRYTTIQSEAKTKNNRSVITSEDYDLEVQEYVGEPRKLDVNGYVPQKQIIGYIIDKTETDIFGNIKEHPPIIIENPNISTTIDLKVKYGSTYQYSIRTVVYIETQAEDAETGEFYIVAYLFSSKNSNVKVLNCVEEVSPPPPADFNVRWDSNKQQLLLEWNFPVNSQRDIKEWQIFKRKSIKEPFQLVKNYNFNDSTIVANDGKAETPEPTLIEFLDNPKTFYVDPDFVKNKHTGTYPTFIYAVCSVDAHGYSSNYSIQFECTFDRFKNKLVKKLISDSGAPKPFPNFYLLTDTFVDTMRTSRKNKSVKIIFTPEYLKVIDSQNNDMGLLKTGQNEFYKLNLLNLDTQEQKSIDISINDKRKTEDVVAPLLIPGRRNFVTKRVTKPRNI